MKCLSILLILSMLLPLLTPLSTQGRSSSGGQTEVWQTFVASPRSTFEWRIDPETQRLNFRHCDLDRSNHRLCRMPILSRGLDPKDLALLLTYYLERLDASGGHQVRQVLGVVAGSIAGVGGYLSIADIVARILPQGTNPHIAEQGLHLLGMGAFLALIYYAWTITRHLYRESVLTNEIQTALRSHPDVPPQLYVSSESIFEEFAITFRRTLWEFTHGGPPEFDDEANLILQ